jgi:hypothetical protein
MSWDFSLVQVNNSRARRSGSERPLRAAIEIMAVTK